VFINIDFQAKRVTCIQISLPLLFWKIWTTSSTLLRRCCFTSISKSFRTCRKHIVSPLQ